MVTGRCRDRGSQNQSPHTRRIIPYATAGAGVTRYRGEGPVAGMNGGYSFAARGIFPFNERDDVTVRQTFDESAPVGVFGGGVNLYLTARSGVRVDARVHVGPSRDEVLLNATPVVTATASGSFVFSATNPSLSFNSLVQARLAASSLVIEWARHRRLQDVRNERHAAAGGAVCRVFLQVLTGGPGRSLRDVEPPTVGSCGTLIVPARPA